MDPKSLPEDEGCHLGHEVHMLGHLIRRRMNAVMSENGADDITSVHGRILGYLVQSEKEVYQRDIEAEFGITRSSVAGILKLMEQKGYIRRESVQGDARLKHIVPTPLGRENFMRIESSIRQVEALMRSAFTAEDYAAFLRLLARLKAVLE